MLFGDTILVLSYFMRSKLFKRTGPYRKHQLNVSGQSVRYAGKYSNLAAALCLRKCFCSSTSCSCTTSQVRFSVEGSSSAGPDTGTLSSLPACRRHSGLVWPM